MFYCNHLYSVLLQYAPENEPMWEPHPNPYHIEVRDSEKKSKFKGVKTFTAYNVIPSVSVCSSIHVIQSKFLSELKLCVHSFNKPFL